MNARNLPTRAARRFRRGWDALTGRPAEPDHVSLGSHCHMAQLLKSAGLRTWSGPFDWLFSAPGMVSDCIEDDFAAFLDRSLLQSVPLAERLGPDVTRCRHLLYGERYGLPFIFNHHDPALSDEDHARFVRAVERLRQTLADPRGHHFYVLALHPVAQVELDRLCDNLARYSPAHHLTFFQIATERGCSRAVPRATERANLLAFDVVTATDSLGVRFADPADDALVLDLIRAGLGRGAGPFTGPENHRSASLAVSDR